MPYVQNIQQGVVYKAILFVHIVKTNHALTQTNREISACAPAPFRPCISHAMAQVIVFRHTTGSATIMMVLAVVSRTPISLSVFYNDPIPRALFQAPAPGIMKALDRAFSVFTVREHFL